MKETDFYFLSLEEKVKFVQRESLPGRKEHLQTLRGIRETLLSKLEGLESLVSSTLLFETEEETHLRGSIRSLQTALSRLDSSISLLENNIQRVEEGESNNL
jgi:predicted RNase H-like nuclease (RuvC/YqgF family)